MMRRLLPLLLVFAAGACAQVPTLTPLTAGDIPALLAPPAHGERIIMLWALHCRYCEPNMRELAKLQRAHPGRIEFVTVSTSSIQLHQQIIARLAAVGMQGYAARAYAAPTPDQLNFLIDPTWGGELPRTIVIHPDGTRVAMSGLLTSKQLRTIVPLGAHRARDSFNAQTKPATNADE